MRDQSIEKYNKATPETKDAIYDDFKQRLLAEVTNHLARRTHPINMLIAKFHAAFSKHFSEFVETDTADSKQELMERIKRQGDSFITRVFESIK